jgi:hypothetical protein
VNREQAPPRTVVEPFLELEESTPRSPTLPELAEQIGGLSSQISNLASHQSITNQRIDEIHRFLLTDTGPRLTKVEQSVGAKLVKRGSITAVAVVALPMLADALPKYRHLFDVLLNLFSGV